MMKKGIWNGAKDLEYNISDMTEKHLDSVVNILAVKIEEIMEGSNPFNNPELRQLEDKQDEILLELQSRELPNVEKLVSQSMAIDHAVRSKNEIQFVGRK